MIDAEKKTCKEERYYQSLSSSHDFVFLRELVSCALFSRFCLLESPHDATNESESKDRRSGHAEWGTIVAFLIDEAPSPHKRIGTVRCGVGIG
jgi:hypothetical protein